MFSARHKPHVFTALIAVITVVPLGTLMWLGWRLLEQDRALEEQQTKQRLDYGVDSVVASLQRAIAASRQRLAAGDKQWAAGAVVLAIDDEHAEVYPNKRVAYVPVAVPLREEPRGASSSAQLVERRDPLEAAGMYRHLARSADPAIRAGALTRLGNTLTAAGRLTEALERGRAETLICLRLDLRSSQVTTIETTLRAGTFYENNRGIGGAVGPDNTTLYVRDWDPAGIASVVALDLTTGNKRTIWSKPVPDSRALSAPALSPDGRTLVMILKDESEKGRVIRVGIDGSGYREIASGLEGPSAQRWEGRAVLFVERRLGQFRLMRVSADGGNPEFTGLTEPDAFAFDVSPDGSSFVITSICPTSCGRSTISSHSGRRAVETARAD